MSEVMMNWVLLCGVFTVALISPGPDFVMAVKNSILYSRRVGVLTAIGFALGVVVHMVYTLAGLATLMLHVPVIFEVVKYAGAAYLIYVGIKSLRSTGFSESHISEGNGGAQETKTMFMPGSSALWSGFLTNVLNPKATLFFLAIFSQFITPQTSWWVQGGYALTCVVMTALWFSLVAVVLTHAPVRQFFLSFSKWIDRVCGGLFILLGLKLAFTKGVLSS